MYLIVHGMFFTEYSDGIFAVAEVSVYAAVRACGADLMNSLMF